MLIDLDRTPPGHSTFLTNEANIKRLQHQREEITILQLAPVDEREIRDLKELFSDQVPSPYHQQTAHRGLAPYS